MIDITKWVCDRTGLRDAIQLTGIEPVYPPTGQPYYRSYHNIYVSFCSSPILFIVYVKDCLFYITSIYINIMLYKSCDTKRKHTTTLYISKVYLCIFSKSVCILSFHCSTFNIFQNVKNILRNIIMTVLFAY